MEIRRDAKMRNFRWKVDLVEAKLCLSNHRSKIPQNRKKIKI